LEELTSIKADAIMDFLSNSPNPKSFDVVGWDKLKNNEKFIDYERLYNSIFNKNSIIPEDYSRDYEGFVIHKDEKNLFDCSYIVGDKTKFSQNIKFVDKKNIYINNFYIKDDFTIRKYYSSDLNLLKLNRNFSFYDVEMIRDGFSTGRLNLPRLNAIWREKTLYRDKESLEFYQDFDNVSFTYSKGANFVVTFLKSKENQRNYTLYLFDDLEKDLAKGGDLFNSFDNLISFLEILPVDSSSIIEGKTTNALKKMHFGDAVNYILKRK